MEIKRLNQKMFIHEKSIHQQSHIYLKTFLLYSTVQYNFACRKALSLLSVHDKYYMVVNVNQFLCAGLAVVDEAAKQRLLPRVYLFQWGQSFHRSTYSL